MCCFIAFLFGLSVCGSCFSQNESRQKSQKRFHFMIQVHRRHLSLSLVFWLQGRNLSISFTSILYFDLPHLVMSRLPLVYSNCPHSVSLCDLLFVSCSLCQGKVSIPWDVMEEAKCLRININGIMRVAQLHTLVCIRLRCCEITLSSSSSLVYASRFYSLYVQCHESCSFPKSY